MMSILRDKYIYFLLFTVSILTWLTGASVGWSSPITYKLTKHTYDYPFDEDISKEDITWIASVAVLGCIFGSLAYGKLPDLIGRKKCVLLLAAPYILAYGILTWGKEVYLYIIARIIIGLLTGGFFAVISLYLGELARPKQRGLFNCLIMTIVYFGQIFSFSLAPYISITSFNLIFFITSVIYLPVLYFVAPETPYYLASQGKYKLALETLEKLRGCSDEKIKEEFEDIKLHTKKDEDDATIMDIFRSVGGRRAFFTMSGFFIFQAATGVNPILMYAEIFFKQAGTEISSAISPIIVGSVQLITTIIVSFTCDKVGRKKLLLVSSIGTGVPLIVLRAYFFLQESGQDVTNISWLPLVSLIFCLIFHGAGLGPLPAVLMGELFPMKVKCIGSTLVITLMCLETFLLSKYFVPVSDAIGMAPVVSFFGVMSFCCFAFTYFVLVETNGKTMNQIQTDLENWELNCVCRKK